MEILDCTLRDGGYYNAWDFPTALVQRYLDGIAASGIRKVELGFRTFENSGFSGALAHTTDVFIQALEVPQTVDLGVMINGKELSGSSSQRERQIDSIFSDVESSPVSFVRIATTIEEFRDLSDAIRNLLDLGYVIGLNLMQIHSVAHSEIREFGAWCADQGVTVAYFADSFGTLLPSDIPPIVSALLKGFGGPIGCHLHDNRSMAMANTLSAIDAGASWADSTIRGMGRGPGNARTELLALEMAHRGDFDFDLTKILSLLDTDFSDLQDFYRWGTNSYYLLSGLKQVHPSYVQRMISDVRFAPSQIIETIERLKMNGGEVFDLESAANDMANTVVEPVDLWDASGWCSGRTVVLVGPGQSLATRIDDFERFITANELAVINLNLAPLLGPNLVDVFVACNPSRVLMDCRPDVVGDSTVITPPGVIEETFHFEKHFLWGMTTGDGQFEILNDSCVLPHGLVAGYAMALAIAGGADRILLAGLDGFRPSDPRERSMTDLLILAQENFEAIEIAALTPTSYPVKQISLYSPFIQ